MYIKNSYLQNIMIHFTVLSRVLICAGYLLLSSVPSYFAYFRFDSVMVHDDKVLFTALQTAAAIFQATRGTLAGVAGQGQGGYFQA